MFRLDVLSTGTCKVKKDRVNISFDNYSYNAQEKTAI